MAKSNNQKMKILYLLDLFQNPESEGMVYPMQEIVALLAEKGISAERKSIYDDLEALRTYGLDIRFRKERPSGYYLAGEKEITFFEERKSVVQSEELEPENVAEPEKIVETEVLQTIQESVQRGYVLLQDTGEQKEIKLSCTEIGKAEVYRVFGKECPCKQKEEGRYQILVRTAVGKSFYGWLLSNENEVRIQKPKKEAAAFRDYLKEISKIYKV